MAPAFWPKKGELGEWSEERLAGWFVVAPAFWEKKREFGGGEEGDEEHCNSLRWGEGNTSGHI